MAAPLTKEIGATPKDNGKDKGKGRGDPHAKAPGEMSPKQLPRIMLASTVAKMATSHAIVQNAVKGSMRTLLSSMASRTTRNSKNKGNPSIELPGSEQSSTPYPLMKLNKSPNKWE